MMRGRESDTWVVKTSNISFELGGHTALTRTDILSLWRNCLLKVKFHGVLDPPSPFDNGSQKYLHQRNIQNIFMMLLQDASLVSDGRVDKVWNVNIKLSALTNQKSYHWIVVSKCQVWNRNVYFCFVVNIRRESK